MDFICRICQQSEVEKLISISCTAATQKRICDLIGAVTDLSVEEFDRLPQHVCSECFGRLDRTYRLWELCRNAVRRDALHQKQQNDHRCRICCALIEGEACRKWNMAIGDMVQHLTGTLLEINANSHSWFVCTNCLLEMDAAYEFKSRCIESEASLLKTRSFMWERMEVDPCHQEHLVIDLYAEAVQEQNDLGRVHCSVCLLEVEMQQLGQKCEGCMLQFRNYDEIRSVQASLCAEEKSRTSLVEIDSVWLEENLSQEFRDDELDEKCLIGNDVKFEIEMDTEAGNDNHAEAEVTESIKKRLVYIDYSKTQYEISEKFPDDPFPKARRTGPFCCKCKKFFDTRLELQAHTKRRHKQPTGQGEFSCDVCLSLFADQQSLELHKAKFQTFFYYFCKSCQVVFSSPYNLLQHKKTFHKELETVQNKSATSVDESNTRAKDGTVVKPTSQPTELLPQTEVETSFKTDILVTYDCCLQNCRNRYLSEEQLLRHLNTAHYQPKQLLKNVCKYCEVKFPNETALLKHSNRKIEGNMYRCLIDGCSFTCTVKRSIILHCNLKHYITSTNEQHQKLTRESRPMDLEQLNVVANESVSVDKNSTKATEETALGDHRMVEASAMKPTYQPTEGSSPTEDETNFKTDILVTYECCLRNCKNRYSSEEQLTEHMNTAHDQSTQVLGNVCQYCNVEFLNETALLNHRKVERTIYRCLIDGCCFKRFTKKCIIQHCNQEPHVKYSSAHDKKTLSMMKSRPLDFKHFSVVRKMDDNTDVVERKSELCCRCFLLFNSKEELTKHCEEHSTEGEQPFHCQVCSRGFRNQSTYTHHRNLTEKSSHYFCRVCEKILWTKVDYIIHRVALHFPEDKKAQIETMVDDFFTCCGCKEQFGTEAELVEHRREKHQPPSSTSSKPNPKVAKCDYCHSLFYKASELEKHTTLYESRITYKCKLPSCAFRTKELERIRRHILSTNHRDAFKSLVRISVDPSEYGCCILGCEFRSQDYNAMIKHGVAMHAQKREYFSIVHSDRKFKCLVCGKGFVQEITMINHKHRRQKQKYQCQGCELYVPRTERSSHARCVEKLKVKCEICDKMLISQMGLKQHIKIVHSNESEKYDKYVCNICGKKVKHLLTHMEMHKNERNWECKICTARFNHVNLLRNHHQRVHLNEKKYACRHGCEKRYKAPGDRDRHERLVHLGITPFRCDFCEASFIRQRDLRLHQRKHTGLKLYPCLHCDASFNKKSEYDDHCRQCKGSVNILENRNVPAID